MQGIIMRGPSVLSTLAGNKTQTRRVIKGASPEMDLKLFYDSPLGRFFYDSNAHKRINIKIPHPVGAVRYVKEAYWLETDHYRHAQTGETMIDQRVIYAESRPDHKSIFYKQSPLFMPAKHSRLHIKITGVRVERVQSISDADVMREGCYESKTPFHQYTMNKFGWYSTPKEAYKHYFIQINGPKAWDDNLWVFVYDYEEVWRK